ncbi:uncharacterized protein L201_005169 [Kwoniella dendrophila CBS 6074]|uniref:U1-type domain-containing protein n=1 Tax=Kwoniella dendrophila CBS 6074 TaxID=1295534 RepID=A0AAX4JXP1_9TREE
MPLYKLTEKRLKKRAREDENGITEIKSKMREMGKAVDSASEDDDDESMSGSDNEGWSEDDSDDDDDNENDEDDGEEEEGDLDIDVDGLDSGSEDENDDEDEDEDGDEDASSSSSVFPISIESALTQPIYRSPNDPAEQLCVLCPDKSLKSDEMIKVHLGSKGHKRSLKRYSVRITTNPPDESITDPREIVEDILADMDAGELDGNAKRIEGETEVNVKAETSNKRKRNNKKERKVEKAQKLLAGQTEEKEGKQDKINDKSGQLNRKARRLLALQKGEIKQKQIDKPTPKASKQG